MPISTPARLKGLHKYRLRRHLPWRASLAGLVVAGLGAFFIFNSFAATNPASADLNGDGIVNLTDMSILLSHFNTPGPQGDIDASGSVNLTDLSILLSNYGKTVTTPPGTPGLLAPPNIKALTGGSSIGLRWDTSTTPAGMTIKQYNILRNGAQIGIATPLTAQLPAPAPEIMPAECLGYNGNCYIDKTVTKGVAYNYQIQAVSNTGAVSALSSTIQATNPTNGVPEPTVTLQLNGHVELSDVLQNKVIPSIKFLYPKVADYLSQGQYTVPTNITINVIEANDPDTVNYYNAGGVITVNAGYAQTQQSHSSYIFDFMSSIMDMALLHDRPQDAASDWTLDSIKPYLRAYFHHTGIPAVPQGLGTYTQDDKQTAYFLNWIQQNYDSDYVHKLAVMHAKKSFNLSYSQFSGGKDLDQLWSEMLNLPSHTGNIVHASSGKCLTGDNTYSDSGKLTLATCSNASNQKVTLSPTLNGQLELHMQGRCVGGLAFNSTTPTSMVLKSCSKPIGTQWYRSKDAASGILSTTIFNTTTNKTDSACLGMQGGSTADGTPLIAAPCAVDTTKTYWTVPANSPAIVKGMFSFTRAKKCLDTGVAGPQVGTQVVVQACDFKVLQPQQFIDIGTNSDNTIRFVQGQCFSPENENTANGTKLVITYCADSKAQLWRYTNGRVVNAVSGKCMDTANGTISDNQGMVINDCNNSESQLLIVP